MNTRQVPATEVKAGMSILVPGRRPTVEWQKVLEVRPDMAGGYTFSLERSLTRSYWSNEVLTVREASHG